MIEHQTIAEYVGTDAVTKFQSQTKESPMVIHPEEISFVSVV
jgi:hypothetical protein